MDKFVRFRYMPCKPLGEDGRCVTASDKHIALSREASSEGVVMVKNINKTLPLDKNTKLALFGKANIEYIKGGGGSGDVYCPYVRNICDGLRNSGFSLYEPLVEFYDNYIKKASVDIPTPEQINSTWDIVNNMEFCQKRDDLTYDTFASMHVKEPYVSDDIIADSAENSDAAIITLSRFSAEGTDRRPVGGDYYLSDLEKELIDRVCDKFDKVIILINSGAVLDCEYFADNDRIGAVLFVWQGGMEGGSAIADVISGKINPSGKLADTVARSYDFYPGVEDYLVSFDYVDYPEDIYVGYRYFETIPGKENLVRYPFGFGLSYTEFDYSVASATVDNGKISIRCEVKNTGNVPGKEVVQLYFGAPQGILGKPKKQLCAFAKTNLLKPNETQTVELVFDVNSMASFDDLGKIRKSAYILEKGTYRFFLGTDVRSASVIDFEYILDNDTVVCECSSYCTPSKLGKRMLSDGTYESLPIVEKERIYTDNKPFGVSAPEKLKKLDDIGESVTLEEFVAQFTIDELCDFVGGKPPVGVCNTGCFGNLPRLGIPSFPTADGPAGLRLDTAKLGIPTTAWPSATLLACTWNPDIVYQVGKAGGAEIRENNIGVWLAPAVNIHRNPLCGRNFEYYSEDPVLAGKCCSAHIRGVQSSKVAVSLKHFACNNKEPNRFASDSRLSERALREIYLKAFEICVREADPWSIMSSYNLINGVHTSESYDLLTGILRKEWGFNGMVVTDWGQKNNPVLELKAGNDMKMHMGYPEELKAAYEDGIITRADLELSASRIVNLFLKLAE